MTSLKIDSFKRPINLAEIEETVLDYWEENKIFEKSVEERPIEKPFVFYDGPPFATGLPHYGHILASTTKDVFPRYFTMKGFRVERQWGWDCHGLPIENIIEKELGLKDKQAIEKYGVANFNEACKKTVLKYANEWKIIIKRLGRWVDMDHDYKTMEPRYMESLWWVFKQLWEKKLIYKGHKSMHICPRCSTPLSNFEVTQGYKNIKDISVYTEFKVLNALAKLDFTFPLRIIAWTTTPWTLPGNVLLAVHPDAVYAVFTGTENDKAYLAAKNCLSSFMDAGEYRIIKEFKGRDLEGLIYEPQFPYFKQTQRAFRVVSKDFVSLLEGSGVVHIAPAFGENDYEVGKVEGVPLVQHVGMDGRFTEAVVDFKGMAVKPIENPTITDVEIIKYLQQRDLVFKKVNITHSYPHCWRCDTPLINYATSSWFVKVSELKEKLLINNRKITWLPGNIKNGRFGKWLEGARDWAISRNRFWGTPLPIWISEDEEIICVGSIEELERLSGEKIYDLHKHIVDNVVINRGGKVFRRIPEVLDCWFESGSMPYASFHYPFENKEKFERSFPAEFISEGQDQTRGWFYTLHVLATALTLGKPASIPVSLTSSFKNVIVNGIVLAEDGKKMSKRLHNYPDPMLIGEKYGIDSLRLYLMSSTVMRAENLNFSEKGVEDVRKKVINTIFNVFNFYKLYDDGNKEYGFEDASHVMDRWLVSRVENITCQVTKAMDSYDIVTATRLLTDFVDEFSTCYLRLSRDRFRKRNKEALRIFKTAIYRWSLMVAPIAPFITELIYQNLPGLRLDSIHLESWPKTDRDNINNNLEESVMEVRRVMEKANAIRKDKAIKNRQPLSLLKISSSVKLIDKELINVLAKELNVKKVIWLEGQTLEVFLDVTLTSELLEEGEAREIIRKIQDARRAIGTKVNEIISVELPTWPEKYEEEIKVKVKADNIIKGKEVKIIRH